MSETMSKVHEVVDLQERRGAPGWLVPALAVAGCDLLTFEDERCSGAS